MSQVTINTSNVELVNYLFRYYIYKKDYENCKLLVPFMSARDTHITIFSNGDEIDNVFELAVRFKNIELVTMMLDRNIYHDECWENIFTVPTCIEILDLLYAKMQAIDKQFMFNNTCLIYDRLTHAQIIWIIEHIDEGIMQQSTYHDAQHMANITYGMLIAIVTINRDDLIPTVIKYLNDNKFTPEMIKYTSQCIFMDTDKATLEKCSDILLKNNLIIA